MGKFKKGHKLGFKKGHIPWNTNKKLPNWIKDKIKKSCIGINIKPHIFINCGICGNRIELTVNASKTKRFCSKNCHNKWKSIHQIGENNPNYGNGDKIRGNKNPMANPIYREKAIKNLFIALKVKPNKQEHKLLELINKLKLPFKYNFGKIIIGGKVPDFYHISKHKLIEYNGNYWHRNDKGEKIKLYKKFGYDCIYIWENELNDINKLRKKLIKYAKV